MIILNESMNFKDPKESDDPQLEVWTLIIEKSTVIPPSLMVLFFSSFPYLLQNLNQLKSTLRCRGKISSCGEISSCAPFAFAHYSIWLPGTFFSSSGQTLPFLHVGRHICLSQRHICLSQPPLPISLLKKFLNCQGQQTFVPRLLFLLKHLHLSSKFSAVR